MYGIHGIFAIFITLLNVFSTGCCIEQVPLVMWSSEGKPLLTMTPPAAGHIVSRSQLLTYLSSALDSGPRIVVLFLHDKLSMEDFTVYGGVYGNKEYSAFPSLESALQSSVPLVLPSVSTAASRAIPELLQEHLGTVPVYLNPEDLTPLSVNTSEPGLFVLRLPSGTRSGDMSPKDTLREHDQVVGRVLSTMQAQAVPYTAVYTALMPSRVTQDLFSSSQSVGRTLLQSTASNDVYSPLYFRDSLGNYCILLWAKNLTVSFFQGQWKSQDLTGETFGPSSMEMTGSFCNTTDSKLNLNYKNVLGFTSFSLSFVMSRSYYKMSARYWFSLDYVELEYDQRKATFNGSQNIYAPTEYSYHCESVSSSSYPLLVPFNSTDASNQWSLTFTDFQIQGFNVTSENFSYASDCAGFFTPGIWMGLVTSLLLLLILTYGLHMLMQLRTMDRFNDPKGPAIAVPQSE